MELECWGCAGADHLAWDRPDAAEAVRAAALEIVGVAWPEDSTFVVDGDL
jgi:hypothetical protein